MDRQTGYSTSHHIRSLFVTHNTTVPGKVTAPCVAGPRNNPALMLALKERSSSRGRELRAPRVPGSMLGPA